MKITYLGGAETVTGSKFLVQTDSTSILVDCGLFQGYKWLRERNREAPPLDVERLDAVVLSHAHLDHSGYIPVLKKLGFRGPVFTHHASRELASCCRIAATSRKKTPGTMPNTESASTPTLSLCTQSRKLWPPWTCSSRLISVRSSI